MKTFASAAKRKFSHLKNLFVACTVLCSVFMLTGTAQANFFSALLPTCTLSGKITTQNQEPIEGATVVFVSDGLGIQSKAVTDALGNYVIHPPSRTSGTLTLSKASFFIIRENISSGWYDSNSYNTRNFTMIPNWISGKITAPDGTPLAGAKLTFEQNGGLAGVQTVTTDENGNYKYTLPANQREYWLTISCEGYKTARERWNWVGGGQVYNYVLR